jgi:two-component system response regulator FixJ
MRVYVVDDDPPSRKLLERIIAHAGHEPGCFPTTTDLIEQIDALPFGCVLLDINMPDGNGLDLLDDLLARDPSWPVVMVSGSAEVDDAIVAFRPGAIHFLRKPFRRDALLLVLSEVEQIVYERMADYARRQNASSITLTPREREVLEAMANGEQSKVIAWKLGLSTRTVEMHRSNILAKLHARNASQAVAIARELGLIDGLAA